MYHLNARVRQLSQNPCDYHVPSFIVLETCRRRETNCAFDVRVTVAHVEWCLVVHHQGENCVDLLRFCGGETAAPSWKQADGQTGSSLLPVRGRPSPLRRTARDWIDSNEMRR